MKRRLSLGLGLAVALAAGPAAAQSDADRATARQLGREGGEALKANEHAKALDLFSRAERLYKAPTLSLGRARALAGTGKLVSALEAYRGIVREGPGQDPTGAFAKAVAAASAEAARLEPRLGGVILTLQGPGSAQITLDGEPFPDAALGVKRPVDPGPHLVRAQADGFAPAEANFEVAEGGSASVALRLERRAEAPIVIGPPGVAPAPAPDAAPPAPPAARGWGPPLARPAPPPAGDAGEEASRARKKTLGLALFSVGAVGLVVGGVTGLVAMGKHDTLDDECPAGRCPSDQRSTLDQFRTFSKVSTVTVIGGLAGVTAGVFLLKSAAPKRAAGATAGVWLGPGSAGLAGRF